jgi:hypothetical protein
VSPVVHTLPSLHGLLLPVCAQPVTGWQVSVVHTLPSSQEIGSPTQVPAEQRSPVVQTLLSLHVLVSLFTYWQPRTGSHESSVHGLLSLQITVQGAEHSVVVNSSVHESRVPVSPPRSSLSVRVHVPFGFSPRKAASASSGTSVGLTTLLALVVSVTRFDPAKVSAVNGTWLPGSALSSHIVPLKTLSFPLPLIPSLEIVTTVPDGDFRVKSRSPGKLWRMLVFSRTFPICAPAPPTTRFEVSVAGVSARATGVAFENEEVAVVGATA